jgi:hypothetical protein
MDGRSGRPQTTVALTVNCSVSKRFLDQPNLQATDSVADTREPVEDASQPDATTRSDC